MRESGANVDLAGTSAAAGVFARLYEQHLPAVYRYIHYRVSDVQLAEDLTSAVFEKALAGFQRYHSDQAAFLTWLLTISRNAVIDHYRRRARRHEVALDEAGDVLPGGSSPEQEAIRNEELQRLQFCLARLSRQEQEIVSSKFGAEMNNRQIAGVLGLSESNIGTILYRAVRKLRDCFREWEYGQGR
ncbi:MAG: sigma-70 family RNA polymerase sigma factor [Chloroflexi bacterium]|nr:sigma-70 family RNA polymerase sigma factor [Chloroflexota bacterium]